MGFKSGEDARMQGRSSLTEPMARHILEYESFPRRFELFCVDLFRDIEGTAYVPTSRSWDLGKDGRGALPRDDSRDSIICCSLTEDLDPKIRSDLDRIRQHLEPNSVLFCSTQRLSELREKQICAQLQILAPAAEHVAANGLEQISLLAVRHPSAIENHYAAEIGGLRDALTQPTGSADAGLLGMRIALTTQLHEEAQDLREEVTANLILTALLQGEARRDVLAKRVSDSLHLPRIVQPSYITSSLEHLVATGLVAQGASGAFVICESGASYVAEAEGRASERLARGRYLVQGQIRDLSGIDLDEKEFSLLWRRLQDGIGRVLLANGAEILESIASICEGDTEISDHPSMSDMLKELGEEVAALQLRGPDSRHIAQAVVDMFHERQSECFWWLTDLCAVYVSICALGLEPTAQEQVKSRLRETDLFLDTDVVLSLLSTAEPNHESIGAMVDFWRQTGGGLYASTSILEEAANHAWISDADYHENRNRLGAISDAESLHLLQTVFVRDFRKVADGAYGERRWAAYIREFKGSNPRDFSKILGHLREFGIDHMKEYGDNDFGNRVKQRLIDMRSAEEMQDSRHRREIEDKSKRDGRLVSLLGARRRTLSSHGRTCVIVTSSPRLRRACRQFGRELGEPEPAITVSALGYVLALLPGVHAGLKAITKLLFDVGYGAKLGPLESRLLRVIRQSGQFSLHWSRRFTLSRMMHEQIGKIATQRGEKTGQVEQHVMGNTAEGVEIFTEVVAGVMDRIYLDRSEQRLLDLERENRQLRDDLERERRRKRG